MLNPNFTLLLAFAAMAIAAVAVIVYIQEGQRRIPIQYASRVRGRRMYSGGQTFLPLRVNQAGVIPIIFAVSILLFPQQIASYFTTSQVTIVADIARGIVTFFSPRTFVYILLYFLLTVGFTYFYTAFTFKPDETAEQLRKNGGFIPGIRPGRPTQDYLARVVVPDHLRRCLLPGDRRRGAGRRGHRHPGSRDARPRWDEPADRRLGRGRNHEADRSAADDAQLRGVYQVTVPVTTATPMTGHSRVVGSARSLTHLKVRALTFSPTPWTDLAMGAATGS